MASLDIPMLGPGTRVDVLLGKLTLACRAARMEGNGLHLMVSESSVRHAPHCLPGVEVRMTLYRAGACWEFQGTIREWVWTQPALLVVGALSNWHEKQRRQEQRASQSGEVSLTLENGARYCGQTLDISSGGISFLIPTHDPLAIGAPGRMTLRLGEDEWCPDIPVRIARLENWLHTRGRSQRVGAALEETLTAEERARWESALTRLGKPRASLGERKAA